MNRRSLTAQRPPRQHYLAGLEDREDQRIQEMVEARESTLRYELQELKNAADTNLPHLVEAFKKNVDKACGELRADFHPSSQRLLVELAEWMTIRKSQGIRNQEAAFKHTLDTAWHHLEGARRADFTPYGRLIGLADSARAIGALHTMLEVLDSQAFSQALILYTGARKEWWHIREGLNSDLDALLSIPELLTHEPFSVYRRGTNHLSERLPQALIRIRSGSKAEETRQRIRDFCDAMDTLTKLIDESSIVKIKEFSEDWSTLSGLYIELREEALKAIGD